jgi:hypothetical protein
MEKFEIPESFWLKLLDLTGSSDGKNKGFMCFYFDSEGKSRKVVAPMNDEVTITALRKKIENFLDDWSNRESMQTEMLMMSDD